MEKLAEEVTEALQNEFLNTVVAVQLDDDELQLDEEERIEDYKKKLQIINKKIENGKNCLMFAYEVQRCLPAAVRGIFTGQLNEIRESLRFISECRKFEVRESSAAVKDALGLIWRKDNSLRDVVVDEAMKMFCSENEDRTVANLRTARNLMEIFLENEENEMESIEETVYQMLVTANAFDDNIVKLFCILVILGDDRVRWSALRLIAVVTR
uniref:Condensin complex subunit 1 n=1 Tax=Steinernema glaseri TaxID=37863 RepID=A0A1I8A857_9BILA